MSKSAAECIAAWKKEIAHAEAGRAKPSAPGRHAERMACIDEEVAMLRRWIAHVEADPAKWEAEERAKGAAFDALLTSSLGGG